MSSSITGRAKRAEKNMATSPSSTPKSAPIVAATIMSPSPIASMKGVRS